MIVDFTEFGVIYFFWDCQNSPPCGLARLKFAVLVIFDF